MHGYVSSKNILQFKELFHDVFHVNNHEEQSGE